MVFRRWDWSLMQNLKKFDHVINEFWSDPEHFVSFMNANLFGGSRLIKKEDLVIQSKT